MMELETATAVLRGERADAIAVVTMSPLGSWGEPGPSDFRLLGTMGAASSIGLGLAVGRPERAVWVVDGDGSLLMQLGVLSAIADAAPPNLTLILIDNGIYAVSGAQPVPGPVDWPALLAAAGLRAVACETPEQLRTALRDPGEGPRAIVARCERRRPSYPPGLFASIRSDEEAARIRALHR